MPPEPSRYRNYDQKEEDDENIEVEHPDEDDEKKLQPAEQYGLRELPRVQYSETVRSNQFDIDN